MYYVFYVNKRAAGESIKQDCPLTKGWPASSTSIHSLSALHSPNPFGNTGWVQKYIRKSFGSTNEDIPILLRNWKSFS